MQHQRRVRAPDLEPVRRRPDRRAARPAPALRLDRPGQPRQRPPDLLQGPRLAAAVRDVQGGGCDHRRGADRRPTASSGPGCRATPRRSLPWVDVATGSLGQGLPVGVGIALAGRYLDRLPYHVWVLCGDSEMAEGSIWEALDKAGHYGLRNLTAIVDVNRLGQRGPTELEWDLDTYRRRVEAFGCRALVIDGHDLAAIDEALGRAAARRPARRWCSPGRSRARACRRSRTSHGWHGKPLPARHGRAGRRRAGRRPPDLRVDRAATRPPRRPRAAPRPAEPLTAAALRGGAPRWPPATRTATRCARSARGPTWSPSTARSATPPTPRSSPRRTPTGSSRCSSPSSSWSPPRSGCRYAATGRSPRPSPRSSPAPTTSSGWPASPGRDIAPVRLARRGGDRRRTVRRRWALEDLAALRAVHGSTVLYPSDAVVLRRPRRADGRPPGRQLPAHHPGRVPGALRRRGRLPGRRQQAAARRRPTTTSR